MISASVTSAFAPRMARVAMYFDMCASMKEERRKTIMLLSSFFFLLSIRRQTVNGFAFLFQRQRLQLAHSPIAAAPELILLPRGQTERGALLVNVCESRLNHLLRVGDEFQFAAVEFLPALADELQHQVAVADPIGHAAHGRRAAEDDVRARSDAVRGNRQRLFAHPFGRETDG